MNARENFKKNKVKFFSWGKKLLTLPVGAQEMPFFIWLQSASYGSPQNCCNSLCHGTEKIEAIHQSQRVAYKHWRLPMTLF